MDRAFGDPATGKTHCVWNAPSLTEVQALFANASVETESITEVKEVSTAEIP